MASRFPEPAVSNSGRQAGDAVPTTIQLSSSPRAEINRRKRPHPDLTSDDMAAEDCVRPLRPRKAKKTNSVKKAATAQPYPLSDHFAGPSSNVMHKAEAVLPRTVVKSPKRPADSFEPALVPAEENTSGSLFDDIHEQLTKAQAEIAQLKKQLEAQIQNQEAEKKFVTQSMMLDIVCIKESNKELISKLQRQKYYAAEYAKEQEAECERQKIKATEEKNKHTKAIVDLNFYKDETEHLQNLNKVMEEDLDELRQIENEDRIGRLRNKCDLPPAYGSLDDEDRYPALRCHKDSGSFDVAAFKRTVREDFMQKLDATRKKTDALRATVEVSDYSTIDATIFMDASSALADSSRSLRAALDYAENMFMVNTSTVVPLDNPEEQNLADSLAKEDPPRHIAKRHIARRDFVADRIVKTILDLTWRVISASEIRPVVLRFSPKQKALLRLNYQEADDCLIEALRLAFTLNKFGYRKTSVLWEYQHYFTQVSALRRAFVSLGSGLSYSLFTRSWEWLSDQVETERMHRAPGCEDAEVPDGISPAATDGSDVSSEMGRSESVSSGGSA